MGKVVKISADQDDLEIGQFQKFEQHLLYLDRAVVLPPLAFPKAGGGAVHGVSTLCFEHAPRPASTASLHQLEQLHAALRIANRKVGNMKIPPHPAIIGPDLSRDSLDIHCLPDGRQLRLANTGEGRAKLARIAREGQALVCFNVGGLRGGVPSVGRKTTHRNG